MSNKDTIVDIKKELEGIRVALEVIAEGTWNRARQEEETQKGDCQNERIQMQNLSLVGPDTTRP